ncbi:MAG TPA: hypothetical protein VER98_15070 [Terriglobia bacterium]|nr:hypothetical protein [Terriglobia bacterium]
MKKLLPKVLLLVSMLVVRFAQGGDATSLDIVGYYNLQLYPGENLIANQLTQGDNTLNAVLTNGAAAGSTFTLWDPLAHSFLPLSVYDGSTWSINYTLALGSGGLLVSPVMATNTFVGGVILYTNILTDPFLGPGLRWHPNYANGLYLLSIPDPLVASGDTMFRDVTDRLPSNGESVTTLDPATQIYHTTTYHTGAGWDSGDPMLNIGQSAWFNLGPVAVPEPGVAAIVVLAIGMTAWRSRSRH